MATIILDHADIDKKLTEIEQGWAFDSQAGSLIKTFKFKGYLKTMSFVNAVAWQANTLMHHPDMTVSFNQCVIQITTHDSGNQVTQKDFELAAAIDALGIK